MIKSDTYNKYVKEYEPLFQRDFEKGLDNTEIIELANAVKQVSYIVNSKVKKLKNIYEYQKKCLTFPEYDERHRKTMSGFGRFYFDEFIDNINSIGFFELLTVKNKKSSSVIFRVHNRRDDVSAKSFDDFFKQFKLICDEYDAYFNNKGFYIKRFLNTGESTKDEIVNFYKDSLYVGKFDEESKRISGVVHNIKHDEDANFDFYTSDFSIDLEQANKKYYSGIKVYLEEFYPEYIV